MDQHLTILHVVNPHDLPLFNNHLLFFDKHGVCEGFSFKHEGMRLCLLPSLATQLKGDINLVFIEKTPWWNLSKASLVLVLMRRKDISLSSDNGTTFIQGKLHIHMACHKGFQVES
jgi:hypothetical protein